MGQNVRGFTDEVKGLNAEPIIGSPEAELLSVTLTRIAKHIDSPVRIYASEVPDEYLFLAPSLTEMGDGGGKITPPIQDFIGIFTGGVMAFQSRTAPASVLIDGEAFTFPQSTVGKYRRLAFSLNYDGTLPCRWSDEADSVPELMNAGVLFSTLGGLPCGFIDLECTFSDGNGGKFKTADSATNIIEHKVGSETRVFRFGAGIAPGGGTDLSFKIGGVTAAGTTVIKGGSLALASGKILATYSGAGTTEVDFNKDLTFDLDSYVTAVNDTTYYIYLDLYALPTEITLTDSGRKLVPITGADFVVLATDFETVDQHRYARIGVVRRRTGTWSTVIAVTYPTKRINDLTAVVSPTIFEVEQIIGSPGGLGKELVDINFPSASYAADMVAWYPLTDLLDSYGLHDLTNNNATPFTGTGITGKANTCASLNGASQFLSSTDPHFDPGDTDFFAGGWFTPTSWNSGTQVALFSQWNSSGTNTRSFLVSLLSGVLTVTVSLDGGDVNVFTATRNVAQLSGAHHVAIRYTASSNTIELLLDGSPVASTAGASGCWAASGGSGGPKFNIGAANSGGMYFPGLVDEFFFVNGDALTNAELSTLIFQLQISAGHVLGQLSFPAVPYVAGKLAYYNLSALLDGYGAHALSNPNSAPFDGTGIAGDADGCVRMTSGSSHYLSSIADHFDPGDTDFTIGGWFDASLWKPSALKTLFSCGSTGGTDYARLDLVTTTGDLNLIAYTTGAESKNYTYGLGSGWVHIALRYVAATNTFTLFVNAVSKGDLVLSGGLGTIGGTRRFVLGARANLSQFWDGRIDEVFFCNGYAFSGDDILKAYSAKILHYAYTTPAKQMWSATNTVGDFVQQLSDFVVDMDSTAVYVDLSQQLSSSTAYLALQSKGFGGSVSSSSSRIFEGTAGDIDALGTFSHGLLGLPTALALLVDIGGGFWEHHDASSYFKTSLTQVAPAGGSTLTDILGGAVNVKLLVSVGPGAVYVPPTPSSGWNTSVKSSAYALQSQDEILTDSSGGPFTLTLPATPSLGDRVRAVDAVGSWAPGTAVTIARAGNKINGVASDLVCNTPYGWYELVFGGVDNWVAITK